MAAVKPETAEKTSKSDPTPIVVRLPPELRARIVAYAKRNEKAEAPGPSWTVSGVVRKLLAQALGEAEGEGEKDPGPKGGQPRGK
jgi:hypothetical protein